MSKQLIKAEETVKNCTEVELRQGLGYGMMSIGLKSTPSEVEAAILSEFLRENYSDYTSEEIKYVFKKAMARKFGPDLDVKNYGSFSCEYVGRILHAYESWSRKGNEYHVSYGHAEAAYKRYLKGELQEYFSLRFYEILTDAGLISKINHSQALRAYPRLKVIMTGFEYLASLGWITILKERKELPAGLTNENLDRQQSLMMAYND